MLLSGSNLSLSNTMAKNYYYSRSVYFSLYKAFNSFVTSFFINRSPISVYLGNSFIYILVLDLRFKNIISVFIYSEVFKDFINIYVLIKIDFPTLLISDNLYSYKILGRA